jgi:hypothetical protein
MANDPSQELSQATVQVESIIARVREIAAKLEDWEHLMLTSARKFSIGASAPPRTASLNLELWPSAEEIDNALTRYERARSAARRQQGN